MAYNPSALNLADATSADWAIAWTRYLMADTTEPHQHTTPELEAALTAHAFTYETVVYYRPHVTAAALTIADPNRATSESLLGASISTRSAGSIARSIRGANAWVDDLIETTAGARPPTGRTLTPVW